MEDHLVVAREFHIHHGRVALDAVITELLCARVGRVAEIDAEFPLFLIIVDLAGAETGPLRYLKLGPYEIVFRMLDLAGLGHFDGGDAPAAANIVIIMSVSRVIFFIISVSFTALLLVINDDKITTLLLNHKISFEV